MFIGHYYPDDQVIKKKVNRYFLKVACFAIFKYDKSHVPILTPNYDIDYNTGMSKPVALN